MAVSKERGCEIESMNVNIKDIINTFAHAWSNFERLETIEANAIKDRTLAQEWVIKNDKEKGFSITMSTVTVFLGDKLGLTEEEIDTLGKVLTRVADNLKAKENCSQRSNQGGHQSHLRGRKIKGGIK